jgi:PAS domain S-box-containing protein
MPAGTLFSSLKRSLARIFFCMLVLMFLYELVKQVLIPTISIWESHVITILFTSALAVIIVYFPLRSSYNERETARVAETALRESEEKFRDIFDKANDAIEIIELRDDMSPGRYIDVNEVACRMHGYTKEEMLQHSPLDFDITDFRSRLSAEIVGKLQSAGHATFETRHRRKDGVIIPVEVNYHIITLLGERVGLSIVRDITGRKQVEAALAESEEKFRGVAERSSDIIQLTDTTGRITYVSPSIKRILGFEPEEIVGTTPDAIVHPEDIGAVHELIRKNMAGSPGAEAMVTRVRKKDGGYSTLEVIVSPVIKDGVVSGMQVMGRDITDRKRIEEALEQSEEKFRGVAERSSDLIILVDPAGNAFYISPSARSILGYDPGEILDKMILELIHPDDLGKIQEDIRKNTAGAKTGRIEVRMRKKDGSYAILETIGSVIIRNGKSSGLQVIGRDITETKASQARIDELLRLQEEQVEIINTSPAVAFLWKAEENWPVETVSENIFRFGYTPDDFISGKVMFGSIIHPDDLGRVAAEVEYNSTHNIDAFYQVYRIFGKDRKEYWIEDFTKIRRDSSGTITHYQGIVLDITERKLAEMERDRLVSVIRHSGELVGLSTPDRKIMFLNEAGAAMLGTTPAEALGHDFSEFVPDHLKENLHSVLLPALIEHGRWEGDLQYRNVKTGNLIDVHAMTFLIGDPTTGAPQFLATVSLDITGRKKAEAELKKYSENLEEMVAERTKELSEAQEQLVKTEKLAVLGKLAGGVGHELRNPLGAIKNAAYFLNMVLENPEPDVKETLEIMTKEVTRSEDILNSLLDFARPTVLTLRKVRINDVIDEAVTRNPIPENIALTLNPDETLPDIMADPDKLLQVFTNLITNAVQAMPDGGSLAVTATSTGEDLLSVSVADTGVGISEENMKKMFEPLFSTKAKGIGLGLVVTKAIVEAHHGHIDIQSEPGKGTTFTVTLPAGIKGGL